MLAIEHENGGIHIETTRMGATLAVRALHDAGLELDFDLREIAENMSEGKAGEIEDVAERRGIVVDGIWTRPPVNIEQVALALLLVSQNAFAYRVQYDGNGEPDTKYHLIGPVERENDPGMLYVLDLGFYNGTWLLGSYQMIEMALREAKRAGIDLLYLDIDDGHPTAAAIPAESQGPIIKALRERGIKVSETTARPLGYRDRNRDDSDAVDDCDSHDDNFGPNRRAIAPTASMGASPSADSSTDEPADAPTNAPSGKFFDATVRCDRCNAQGMVQASVNIGDGAVCLTFCLHHYREAKEKLAEQGAVIDDRSGQV